MRRTKTTGLWVVMGLLAVSSQAKGQDVFPTPEQAVTTFQQALNQSNDQKLIDLFGPESKDLLSSGDPVADRRGREVIQVALKENWSLAALGPDKRELVIGNEKWPFPIPLMKRANGWQFDTAAGKEEVLARRVGRNELKTIQACETYVDAQMEYADTGHDGKPDGLYAQKFASDAGKQNGLFWKTGVGEPLSPLGELAAEAASEGYKRQEGKMTPFHGYFFRILTAQGSNAKGGARNYVSQGELKDGFALIAYPADYGNSGVMTFVVNQDGIVYEKDLGSETTKIAEETKEYNPDPTWQKAE